MHISKSQINNNELQFFLNDNKPTLNNKIKALLKHQLNSDSGFPELIKNMKLSNNSQSKTIIINGISIDIYMNMSRMNSVLANTFVSKKKEGRKCILCNLLEGQKGLEFLDKKYLILTNPGITKPGDLTIASIKHKKQLIKNNFPDMFRFAKEMSDYSIYFNGALAGASCPHFHFQAGLRDILPAEIQINDLLSGNTIGDAHIQNVLKTNHLNVYNIENFLRTTFIATSNSKSKLIDFCNYFLENLTKLNYLHFKNIKNVPDFGEYIEALAQNENEGRVNIMVKYLPEKNEYHAVFFPKLYSRPTIYFQDENKRVILGMAIKEALGNIMTCRQQDYENVISHPEIIKNAYSDTSLPKKTLVELIEKLKKFE